MKSDHNRKDNPNLNIRLSMLVFIYSQISSLNSFVEKILDVLKNHIPELKENSENIINGVQQVYKEENEQSIFNPEYLLNKLMTPNNSEELDQNKQNNIIANNIRIFHIIR